MTEEYVRKHKIYKKLETIIAEHWPRICSSQNTLSRNVLTSPKKKSLNIHSILLEVLQIAGNQVKLLDADQMVRFLQTLRGTIRKIEHQTSILEQCWASYFNAYPYRQQLRRYADLDHQVSILKLKWKWWGSQVTFSNPSFKFNQRSLATSSQTFLSTFGLTYLRYSNHQPTTWL